MLIWTFLGKTKNNTNHLTVKFHPSFSNTFIKIQISKCSIMTNNNSLIFALGSLSKRIFFCINRNSVHLRRRQHIWSILNVINILQNNQGRCTLVIRHVFFQVKLMRICCPNHIIILKSVELYRITS